MAEAEPTGKGSYISLPINMEELKDRKENSVEQEKRPPMEKELLKDILDEFDEDFRRKVRIQTNHFSQFH